MVCNLHFASRVGDNCRTFLRQLGFLHLPYLFAVLFQRSPQLFNFPGEKDELLLIACGIGTKTGDPAPI